jgi:hypothetical protein
VEKIGFKGFFSPYGMKKTGTKIPYGGKNLAGNPVRCVSVLVGKEPVRGSPTKSKE